MAFTPGTLAFPSKKARDTRGIPDRLSIVDSHPEPYAAELIQLHV